MVIGGGFGGLLAGARLREAGVEDIRIIEKGGDFGGTWYWNRYPGAACDIESYIYLPLLEEIGYMPKEKYTARAGDPRAQPRDRRASSTSTATPASRPRSPSCAGTRTPRAGSSRPTAATRMRARFVVMANGPLHRPKLPGIPGIETLQGPLLPHQPLGLRLHRRRLRRATSTGLRDKRVGIIGTGATAVQCVPHLGASAPSSSTSSSARRRRSTCATTARPIRSGRRACSPAGSRQRMDNFNILVSGGFQEEDLVDDGWTDIIRKLLVHGAAGRRRASIAANGVAKTMRARRLREDGADPRARRRDRRRTRRPPRR